MTMSIHSLESCKLDDTKWRSDVLGEGDDRNCALPSHMESNCH